MNWERVIEAIEKPAARELFRQQASFGWRDGDNAVILIKPKLLKLAEQKKADVQNAIVRATGLRLCVVLRPSEDLKDTPPVLSSVRPEETPPVVVEDEALSAARLVAFFFQGEVIEDKPIVVA